MGHTPPDWAPVALRFRPDLLRRKNSRVAVKRICRSAIAGIAVTATATAVASMQAERLQGLHSRPWEQHHPTGQKTNPAGVLSPATAAWFCPRLSQWVPEGTEECGHDRNNLQKQAAALIDAVATPVEGGQQTLGQVPGL